MAEYRSLPTSWESVRVDAAGSVRLGRQRSPNSHSGRHSTKYLRSANITPTGLDLSDVREMDFTPDERVTFGLLPGDILLVEASGSPTLVGRAALWNGEIDECCYQNHIIRFKPHTTLPDYALLVFRYYSISGMFARTARGVGIQHLSASRFAELPFPLPPLAEQNRITNVAGPKLDDLRNAENSLHSALARLSAQTREILAAATVGTLLPHGSPAPPSHQLEIRFVNTAPPPDSPIESRPSNLADLPSTPADPDAMPLPTLPSNWDWIAIEQAGNAILGRQRSPRYQHGSNMRPYLRVANVLEDHIATSDLLTMNFDANEFRTYELRRGDILLNEGQSPHLVGRPAMYRDEIPGACFQNTLIRFRSASTVDPEFALLVFRHYMHSGVFRRVARWSTNIAHLGLQRFRALRFPLPPLREQRQIARAARRWLQTVQDQVAAVQSSIDNLPQLELTLLQAAVSGELAPQHPDDEPASALLRRLGTAPHLPPKKLPSDHREPRTIMTAKHTSSDRPPGPERDLRAILRHTGTPLRLPDLFSHAGYDRHRTDHVELFYLALHSQFGTAIRSVDALPENAAMEAIDAH